MQYGRPYLVTYEKAAKKPNSSFAHPWKHDFVVMIHSLATSAPSHTCCPSLWSAACQGQSPWRAGRAREEEEEEEEGSSSMEEEERSSPEAETAMKPGSLCEKNI